MAESICRGCALTFTSVSAFDRHHVGTDEPPHFVCRDPRTVGLEAKVRSRGGRRRVVWGKPGKRDFGGRDTSGDTEVPDEGLSAGRSAQRHSYEDVRAEP